jgi:hypothetical protein
MVKFVNPVFDTIEGAGVLLGVLVGVIEGVTVLVGVMVLLGVGDGVTVGVTVGVGDIVYSTIILFNIVLLYRKGNL